MIISHKFKFIFIKTRKTAGTSVEVYLSSACGENDIVTPIIPHVEPHKARNYEDGGFFNHISGAEIKSAVGDDTWNSYFKFCVERNPWDKTLSHYHMVNKRSNRGVSLDSYFRARDFPVDRDQYTDRSHKPMVDEILRYENLDAELSRTFKRLGVPFSGDLGVRAKSDYRTDRRHYREILNPEQSNLIKEAFAKEIEWFGYEY